MGILYPQSDGGSKNDWQECSNFVENICLSGMRILQADGLSALLNSGHRRQVPAVGSGGFSAEIALLLAPYFLCRMIQHILKLTKLSTGVASSYPVQNLARYFGIHIPWHVIASSVLQTCLRMSRQTFVVKAAATDNGLHNAYQIPDCLCLVQIRSLQAPVSRTPNDNCEDFCHSVDIIHTSAIVRKTGSART